MASETFAKKNEEYWSRAAESVFKEDWIQRLHAQIETFLADNTDWLSLRPLGKGETSTRSDKDAARMMDYACGNGIVSRSLHAHFCKCIGVDVAEGMLAKYRATAGELGLSEQRMMAVQGDLLAERTDHLTTEPRLSDEELAGFDLVAICMALHHASDVELATRRLAERLRPGGVLLIIDWAGQADWHAHPAAHTVSHESFSEEQIVSLFEQAGCCQPSFVLASEPSDVPPARSGKMQLFFARAKKK